jgi:hypothetical protein
MGEWFVLLREFESSSILAQDPAERNAANA